MVLGFGRNMQIFRLFYFDKSSMLRIAFHYLLYISLLDILVCIADV